MEAGSLEGARSIGNCAVTYQVSAVWNSRVSGQFLICRRVAVGFLVKRDESSSRLACIEM